MLINLLIIDYYVLKRFICQDKYNKIKLKPNNARFANIDNCV